VTNILLNVGKAATEIFEMIKQVYGEAVMPRARVLERCTRVSEIKDEGELSTPRHQNRMKTSRWWEFWRGMIAVLLSE
jgi:hypothetical protein